MWYSMPIFPVAGSTGGDLAGGVTIAADHQVSSCFPQAITLSAWEGVGSIDPFLHALSYMTRGPNHHMMERYDSLSA